MVEHNGLVNMTCTYTHDILGLGLDDRTLSFCSINFDGANWEIWLPLLSGASLYILPEALRRDAEGFCDYLDNNKITTSFIPPNLLPVMPKDKEFASLTKMIVAGEKGSQGEIEHWSQGRTLINGYGLSETTVACTYSVYKDGAKATQIGKPLANMKIYILGEDLQPVPVGVPGELCVAGPGIARGYWNLPEKTADCFVEIKIDGKQERIYRTGDLAQYSPDGNIIFIGRADRQVKIHGKRVELGAVEAAINKHPDVIQCAVKLHEPQPGQPIVVAHVVSNLKENGRGSNQGNTLSFSPHNI